MKFWTKKSSIKINLSPTMVLTIDFTPTIYLIFITFDIILNSAKDEKGTVGNTALMIAAELGYDNIVRLLHEAASRKKDLLRVQNCYGHNALHLATENNKAAVVKYLLNADDSLIEMRNKYSKTPLLVAVEFGSDEAFREILDHMDHKERKIDLEEANGGGNTLLMYSIRQYKLKEGDSVEVYQKSNIWAPGTIKSTTLACEGKFLVTLEGDVSDTVDENHIRSEIFGNSTFDKLMYLNANFEHASNNNETPLMWAASVGNLHATRVIIDAMKKRYGDTNISTLVDKVDMTGDTALMKAATAGHFATAKILIEHAGAQRWITKTSKNNSEIKLSGLHLAILHGHIELATSCFMTDLGTSESGPISMLEAKASRVFSPYQLDLLALKYSKVDLLERLMRLAARYDFHFDLFLNLFPRFRNMNAVLNFGLSEYFKNIQMRVLSDGKTDIDIAYKLTSLMATIKESSAIQPLQRHELNESYATLKKVLDAVYQRPIMNIEKNYIDSLCFMNYEVENEFVDKIVERAYAFRRGPIAISIESESRSIFASGQLSMFVEGLFLSFLRFPRRSNHLNSLFKGCFSCRNYSLENLMKNFSLATSVHSKLLENFLQLRSPLIYGRNCAVFMFIFEALSNLFYLGVLSFVASSHARNSEASSELSVGATTSLAAMNIASLIYEYGELCEYSDSWYPRNIANWKRYARGVWNKIDMMRNVLVFIWLILYRFREYELIAQGMISFSAIISSFGMLRYFFLFESLGKLVLILFAMTFDLISFAIVFFVIIFGFSVTLFSILHGATFNGHEDTYFSTYQDTFVTLFSAALGNYDRDMFKNSSSFYVLAFVTLTFFLVTASLVLISLIVAQMSTTFNAKESRSFEEWQFEKARFTKSFLLIEESNPMCMLPPPFNLITFALFPIHLSFIYHWKCDSKINPEIDVKDKNKIVSICGTASDRLIGVIVSFLAPFVELAIAIKLILTKNTADKEFNAFAKIKLILFIVLGFAFIYPLYIGKSPL
jgi:ankyrin repeat protein